MKKTSFGRSFYVDRLALKKCRGGYHPPARKRFRTVFPERYSRLVAGGRMNLLANIPPLQVMRNSAPVWGCGISEKKKEIRNELGENTISSSSLFAFY